MSSTTDVIIIGAGSAGLSAAKELRRRGLSFVVVEGAHRIGGRAHSQEIAPGVWFDLGCAYLTTSTDPTVVNPFVEIAKELGAEIGEDKGDLFDVGRTYCDGKQIAAGEMAALRSYFEGNEAAILDSVNRSEDRAISELIDLASPYARLYNNSITTASTFDVDQTSAADYASGSDDAEVPILKGYGNLVATWGADVPVSLDTKVEAIDWSAEHIRVETDQGTLRGRCVLCTVSTGVLAAERIRFSPRLPSWKIDAIAGLPTGTENKIGVHFSKDVFGPDGRGVHHVWAESAESAEFEASVMGLNVAVVFTGGRHAVSLEKEGEQAGHDFAVDRIAEVFGNDIRKSVTRSIVTAWTTEPWTLGSYSCALPGQAHQREALARSLDERLFFAGEATMPGLHGSCHGAYLSGVRAAHEIAKARG